MNAATITTLTDRQPQAAGLVWENPPARNGGPGKYAGIVTALKARPGQWALVRTYPSYKRASGFAQSVRSGKLLDFREGRFEVQVHTVDDSARVYVRFQSVTDAATR